MIYLFDMPQFTEDGGYTTWLKIGHIEDNKAKSYFNYIESLTGRLRVLYTIPEATLQDAERLWNQFAEYCVGNSRKDIVDFDDYYMWFNKEKAILDYFFTHTTKESLNGD